MHAGFICGLPERDFSVATWVHYGIRHIHPVPSVTVLVRIPLRGSSNECMSLPGKQKLTAFNTNK
jgi:hypothetical protein